MTGKFAKNFFIFLIISAWIFSGFPPIWQNPPAPLDKYLSGPFPPGIQEAWAATATKTWSFVADTESWTASTPNPNNTTASWQSVDGSPANGSLQMRITGKNKTDTNRIWEIAGTWENIFSIPVGSTVTEVGSGTGNSYNYRVSEYATGAAGNSGPFAFYDNTPTLQGTFSAATAFSGLVAWTAKTGAAISVPAGLQASSNTVRFRITNDLATGNDNGAAVTLRQDQIVLTITYTLNSAPNAPSQDSPANSATGVSVTPTFLMTATDPDSDKLGYKVTIYSENTCTTVEQTNDQAVSATGWTGSDATCTAAPTACYLSGTQGSFLTQTALSASTQYWWKASAKDPDGTGSFTDSATCNTFTTAAAPTLTFSISDNAIGFGTLSTLAVRWATGDGTGSGSETSAHTMAASTNATNGYTITVNGNTLTHTNPSFTINAIGASAADVTAGTGTEQFGIRLTASGGNSVVSAPYNGATNNYALDTAAFPDQVASDADGDDISTTYSVFYATNIASGTEAGAYSANLTYVATGNF